MSLPTATNFGQEISRKLAEIEEAGKRQTLLVSQLLKVNSKRTHLSLRQIADMPDNYARRVRETQQYEFLESQLEKLERDCGNLQFCIDMTNNSIVVLEGDGQ